MLDAKFRNIPEDLSHEYEDIVKKIQDAVHDVLQKDQTERSVPFDVTRSSSKEKAAVGSRRLGYHDLRSPLSRNQPNFKSFVSSMGKERRKNQ